MLRRAIALGSLACLISTTVGAQPGPVNPDKPPVPAPVKPAPVAADEGLDPKIPVVHDPMLKPVGPARRILGSWQQALRIPRNRSPGLQASLAQIESARGRSRQALSAALPRLTGQAGINHHLLKGRGINFVNGQIVPGATIPNPNPTWNAQLTLTQPLFSPQAWYDVTTADESIKSARLSAKDTERLILAGVAEAIVSTITTERLAEIQRINLRSSLSTLDLNKRRAQLGAASAVDVLRAEQEVQLIRAQIVSADESVRRSREALGLALGEGRAWGVSSKIRLDGLARDAANTCKADPNIDNRPDVRAARQNVSVARRSMKSSDWAYAPTINGSSTLTYSEPKSGANNTNVTWTVGALLSWNIYDGGQRSGSRHDARGQLAGARAQLRTARQRAQIEMVQANRAVKVSEATLKVRRKSRDLSRETARLARIAFIYGNGTSLSLIDAARRLQESEVSVAIQEFDVVRSRVSALLAQATCDI